MDVRKDWQGLSVCWFQREDCADHELKECKRWQNAFPRISPRQMRQWNLDFSKVKNSCWSCGLPGDKCEVYQSAKVRCQRQDFVFAVVVYYCVLKEEGYYDVVR